MSQGGYTANSIANFLRTRISAYWISCQDEPSENRVWASGRLQGHTRSERGRRVCGLPHAGHGKRSDLSGTVEAEDLGSIDQDQERGRRFRWLGPPNSIRDRTKPPKPPGSPQGAEDRWPRPE